MTDIKARAGTQAENKGNKTLKKCSLLRLNSGETSLFNETQRN